MKAERSYAEFAVVREEGRVVRLSGVIDENVDLDFFASLHGPVVVNLRGVRRINSYGVRSWIDAIRRLPADAELEFVECPPPVIDQANMIHAFLGRGHVASFYAPMACDSCEHEERHLFRVDDCRARGGRLPSVKCPRCGLLMVIDDQEEQYLLFLRDPG